MVSQDSVIVHFWSPHCSSPICYSIDYDNKSYQPKGYTLIVIADYFDMETIQAQNLDDLRYPLLSIHNEYYDTDICYKYHERFILDLLKQDKEDVEELALYSRHLLFYKAKLVKAYVDIEASNEKA